MKKAILVAAGISLLIACNQTKDSTATNGNDAKDISKYESNVKEVYRAIETGDVSKLDSFMAKDVVDHNSNNGKDIVGLDSLKYHLSQIHNYFDNLKMEALHDAVSPDGEYHFTEVRMTGKSKANPWGMPVGMDVDETGIDLVKVKDGKATDHWGFTSDEDVNKRMQGMMQGSHMPDMKDKTQH